MRKGGFALLGAALLSLGTLTVSAPAKAGWRHGYYGGYGHHHHGYGYRRGFNPGAAIGLGIAGLAIGAIAASAARPRYYDYGYARPVGYYGGYGYARPITYAPYGYYRAPAYGYYDYGW